MSRIPDAGTADANSPRTLEDNEPVILSARKRTPVFCLPANTAYTLKKETLTVNSGLLTPLEREIHLFRIMDTTLRRNPYQRLLGLGSILIASSDQSIPELVIRNIRRPVDFKAKLDELVKQDQNREQDAGVSI